MDDRRIERLTSRKQLFKCEASATTTELDALLEKDGVEYTYIDDSCISH